MPRNNNQSGTELYCQKCKESDIVPQKVRALVRAPYARVR